MTEREKVIKGLECCVNDLGECDFCPYDEGRGKLACVKNLYSDAIALLKAQEPVKPYAEYSEHTGTKWLVCGACEQPMIKITPNAVYPNYCPECGRKVWWE